MTDKTDRGPIRFEDIRYRVWEMAERVFRVALIVFIATAVIWLHKYYGSTFQKFNNIRVQKVNDYQYWFTKPDGTKFYVSVCRDYDAPRFDTGMTLAYAVFLDEGKCWSLNPNKNAGYFIWRDEKGVPYDTN